MASTLPDQKHGTVAEYNGNIVNVENNDNAALTTVTNNNLPVYPSIKFEEIKSEIPHYVSVIDFLEEYAYEKLVNYAYSKWQEGQTFETAKHIYDYFNKPQPTSTAGLPRDLEIHNTGLFKSIAWHPHKEVLAIATNTDDVYLYTKKDTKWNCQVLSHKKMKDIRCIQWKTKATGTLAVGCHSGVCVWTVDSYTHDSDSIRHHPSASSKFFEYEECVTSLAWDPSPGSQLLAVASSASSTLAIQDIVLDRTISLKRHGKGNTLLRWSLDGKWLYVGGAAGKSRVWDTSDWSSKQLKNPPGLWVQAACWLPDNMTLLYSMKGKNDIHALCLFEPSLKKEIWDVKMKTISVPGSSDRHAVRDISIDNRHGQRIVIIFENSPFIGLYNVQISPLNLRERNVFNPIGYIRGAKVEYETNRSLKVVPFQDDTKPLHTSFSSFYKYGAILATAWDNGTITFVTHTFKSARDVNGHFI
ncbi:unnamed protein product [Rhizopus stolonifer]